MAQGSETARSTKSSGSGMPARARRRAQTLRRWPLPEPPPGLFPARDDLPRLFAVLCIAAAAAACTLLSRRPNPFCDSDDPFASGSCEPCPESGRCLDGNLECVEGFKKYDRACVPDGLLTRTATKISQLLQLRICNEHARVLCGQPGRTLFEQPDIANMIDELLAKDHVGLNEDGIRIVKDWALESTQSFFESTLIDNKDKAFKCPELVAKLHRPLTCQVRQWIFTNVIFVMAFCTLFAALLWILWNIHRRRVLSRRAEQIYEQVCEILEDNAINAKIGNSTCEPWVVTSWLRDHLLVPRERRNVVLWKKVEELILEDSRIDQYPKVINGEPKIVFEWQASGSLSAKGKKMQGATNKSRTGVGAIKLAEELGACVGEVSERSPHSLTRKEGTKA